MPVSALRQLLLLVLLLPALRGLAQAPVLPGARENIDLIESDWQRGKNGRQYNFTYTLGADPTERNAGFFGQRIRREIGRLGGLSPEVESHLNSYRRRKWLFLGERVLFGASVITYGALALENQEYFKGPELAVLGVAAFSLITNIFVTRNTNMHMQRAVKAYQGDRVPQRPGTGSLRERLRPDFGGLTPLRGGGVGLAVGWQL